MPTTETDQPEKSIPLALQSLFYKVPTNVSLPFLRCPPLAVPTRRPDPGCASMRRSRLGRRSCAENCTPCQMQFQETSVGTKELTTSFGWDSVDAFTQHDVQVRTPAQCLSCPCATPALCGSVGSSALSACRS